MALQLHRRTLLQLLESPGLIQHHSTIATCTCVLLPLRHNLQLRRRRFSASSVRRKQWDDATKKEDGGIIKPAWGTTNTNAGAQWGATTGTSTNVSGTARKEEESDKAWEALRDTAGETVRMEQREDVQQQPQTQEGYYGQYNGYYDQPAQQQQQQLEQQTGAYFYNSFDPQQQQQQQMYWDGQQWQYYEQPPAQEAPAWGGGVDVNSFGQETGSLAQRLLAKYNGWTRWNHDDAVDATTVAAAAEALPSVEQQQTKNLWNFSTEEGYEGWGYEEAAQPGLQFAGLADELAGLSLSQKMTPGWGVQTRGFSSDATAWNSDNSGGFFVGGGLAERLRQRQTSEKETPPGATPEGVEVAMPPSLKETAGAKGTATRMTLKNWDNQEVVDGGGQAGTTASQGPEGGTVRERLRKMKEEGGKSNAQSDVAKLAKTLGVQLLSSKKARPVTAAPDGTAAGRFEDLVDKQKKQALVRRPLSRTRPLVRAKLVENADPQGTFRNKTATAEAWAQAVERGIIDRHEDNSAVWNTIYDTRNRPEDALPVIRESFNKDGKAGRSAGYEKFYQNYSNPKKDAWVSAANHSNRKKDIWASASTQPDLELAQQLPEGDGEETIARLFAKKRWLEEEANRTLDEASTGDGSVSAMVTLKEQIADVEREIDMKRARTHVRRFNETEQGQRRIRIWLEICEVDSTQLKKQIAAAKDLPDDHPLKEDMSWTAEYDLLELEHISETPPTPDSEVSTQDYLEGEYAKAHKLLVNRYHNLTKRMATAKGLPQLELTREQAIKWLEESLDELDALARTWDISADAEHDKRIDRGITAVLQKRVSIYGAHITIRKQALEEAEKDKDDDRIRRCFHRLHTLEKQNEKLLAKLTRSLSSEASWEPLPPPPPPEPPKVSVSMATLDADAPDNPFVDIESATEANLNHPTRKNPFVKMIPTSKKPAAENPKPRLAIPNPNIVHDYDNWGGEDLPKPNVVKVWHDFKTLKRSGMTRMISSDKLTKNIQDAMIDHGSVRLDYNEGKPEEAQQPQQPPADLFPWSVADDAPAVEWTSAYDAPAQPGAAAASDYDGLRLEPNSTGVVLPERPPLYAFHHGGSGGEETQQEDSEASLDYSTADGFNPFRAADDPEVRNITVGFKFPADGPDDGGGGGGGETADSSSSSSSSTHFITNHNMGKMVVTKYSDPSQKWAVPRPEQRPRRWVLDRQGELPLKWTMQKPQQQQGEDGIPQNESDDGTDTGDPRISHFFREDSSTGKGTERATDQRTVFRLVRYYHMLLSEGPSGEEKLRELLRREPWLKRKAENMRNQAEHSVRLVTDVAAATAAKKVEANMET